MTLHEQGGYRLGPEPMIGHIATCQNCDWHSKPRGKVETARRDFEEHRIATSLPPIVEGECSWCQRQSAQCVQFFAYLAYARLCPDCIKRMHHRNIDSAKANKHIRYAERARHGQ